VQQIGFALKTSLKLMEKQSSICRCDRLTHSCPPLSPDIPPFTPNQIGAGGFTQAQWKQIVDFIHANLGNIHLTELAELVQFSSYHFTMCSRNQPIHLRINIYSLPNRTGKTDAMGNRSTLLRRLVLLARTFHLPLQTACRRPLKCFLQRRT